MMSNKLGIKCPRFVDLLKEKALASDAEAFRYQQRVQGCLNSAVSVIRIALADEECKEVVIPVNLDGIATSIYSEVKMVLQEKGFKFKSTDRVANDLHGPHWLVDLRS